MDTSTNNSKYKHLEIFSDGNLETVKDIIDIEEKDNNSNTPLFLACKGENTNVVKYLLEKGANTNSKNNEGMTALKYFLSITVQEMDEYEGMCDYFKSEILELLLDYGSSLDFINEREYLMMKECLFVYIEEYMDEYTYIYYDGEDGEIYTEKYTEKYGTEDHDSLMVQLRENTIVFVNKLYTCDYTDVIWGGSPLMFACLTENIELVTMILQNKYFINDVTKIKTLLKYKESIEDCLPINIKPAKRR